MDDVRLEFTVWGCVFLTLERLWGVWNRGLSELPGARAVALALVVGAVAGGCTVVLHDRLDSAFRAGLLGGAIYLVLFALRDRLWGQPPESALDAGFVLFIWLFVLGLVLAAEDSESVDESPS